MRNTFSLVPILALVAMAATQEPQAKSATTHSIDAKKSTLTVRAYPSGMFAAYAHDHEISAPIAEGTVDDGAKPSVILRVDAREMQVLDPDLEPRKRTEVQGTMHSDKVLDSATYPEIRFSSTRVTIVGPNDWLVMGALTLHGQTHAVTTRVHRENGRFQGETTIRQTDYGIAPIAVAGGTVSVKNEVKIEFDVAVK